MAKQSIMPAAPSRASASSASASLHDVLQVAKALADESRLRVLVALGGGELCLCQVVDLLGLAPSTVSRHVKELQRCGLVERRKEGRWHYFRLAGDGAAPAAAAALSWLRHCLQGGRDAALLHAQLCCVKEKDLAELTACYANGSRA
jgi:DNA-binding transcriptional ArsR family regulator